MYLNLDSHCACEFCQYGRVMVGRAGPRCGGYFVRTFISFPPVRSPAIKGELRREILNGAINGAILEEERLGAFRRIRDEIRDYLKQLPGEATPD